MPRDLATLNRRELGKAALAASLPLICGGGARIEGPTAQEIIDRVAKAYARCSSYRDTATFVSEIRGPGGQPGDEPRTAALTTAFVRPDRFRLEFRETPADPKRRAMHIVIARELGQVFSWWDIGKEVETPESIHFALGAMAGVTLGASTNVPNLLGLDEPAADAERPLQGCTRVERLDDDPVGDLNCRRIEGRMEFNEPDEGKTIRNVTTHWIDPATALIRRTRIAMESEAFRSVTTIDYRPEVNVEVPDDALRFDPPTEP